MTAGIDRLNDTERTVCRKAAAGASNAEIAKDLGLKEVRVRVHLCRGLQKQGLGGRTALATVFEPMPVRTTLRLEDADDEQRDLLDLLVLGMSYSEIALLKSISIYKVKARMNPLMVKLNPPTRMGLAAWYLRVLNGLPTNATDDTV